MKAKELSFISIFTVLFLVGCIIGALVIYMSPSRKRGISDRQVYRTFYRLQTHMELEDISDFNEEFTRAYVNENFSLDTPDLTQTIFYTGDIPGFGSEYLMTLHRGGEAAFYKVYPNGGYSRVVQRINLSDLPFGEGEK